MSVTRTIASQLPLIICFDPSQIYRRFVPGGRPCIPRKSFTWRACNPGGPSWSPSRRSTPGLTALVSQEMLHRRTQFPLQARTAFHDMWFADHPLVLGGALKAACFSSSPTLTPSPSRSPSLSLSRSLSLSFSLSISFFLSSSPPAKASPLDRQPSAGAAPGGRPVGRSRGGLEGVGGKAARPCSHLRPARRRRASRR